MVNNAGESMSILDAKVKEMSAWELLVEGSLQ